MNDEEKKRKRSEYCKRWREKQGDAWKVRQRELENRRKEMLKANPVRLKQRKERSNHTRIERRKLISNKIRECKDGALRRNIRWELSDERTEELVRSPCHYCHRTGADFAGFNGIDRRDSKERVYTDGNSLPCCGMCNLAKGKKSYEAMMEYIKSVANNRRDLLENPTDNNSKP